jgi:hypothetical protein
MVNEGRQLSQLAQELRLRASEECSRSLMLKLLSRRSLSYQITILSSFKLEGRSGKFPKSWLSSKTSINTTLVLGIRVIAPQLLPVATANVLQCKHGLWRMSIKLLG